MPGPTEEKTKEGSERGSAADAALQKQIAFDTLERYSGSPVANFQPYILLTNFSRYVREFADKRGIPISEGSTFQVAHSPEEKISILDFKIGSPAAALVIDLCAFLPVKAGLLLGMCGGLRSHYSVGEYFVPVAGIRGEGTSDFYFPSEVPSLANFVVQKVVTDVLDKEKAPYHVGITHTTNKRFWEFDEEFRRRLEVNRAQSIDMECATLFIAGYKHRFPVGALLLISDLPLNQGGIKTKESSEHVFKTYSQTHIEMGVRIIQALDLVVQKRPHGISRHR